MIYFSIATLTILTLAAIWLAVQRARHAAKFDRAITDAKHALQDAYMWRDEYENAIGRVERLSDERDALLKKLEQAQKNDMPRDVHGRWTPKP